MSLTSLRKLGLQNSLGLNTNPNLGDVYPFVPPTGYRWQKEMFMGEPVTYGGEFSYYLERIV